MEMLLRDRLVVTLGDPLVAEHGGALPGWFRERVIATRDLTRRSALLQHALLSTIAAAFGEAGVPVLPLKGAALADAVHGDIGARESSDIDLLVEPGDLDRAASALTGLGWREDPGVASGDRLPRLHRVFEHDTLPPVELHWRVHWYEDRYSTEVLRRARPTEDGWLRAQPADELAFLLLFLARDGFAGLRLVVDIAAWWRAVGAGVGPGSDVRVVADGHPALSPALTTAATVAERLAGLPPTTLLAPRPPLTGAQRMAVRLANPWLEGSMAQINAEVSLIDGLLAPAGGGGAFVRRRIVSPADEALRRSPELEHGSRWRVLAAQAAHAGRVLGRYGLAGRRLARGQR